MVFDCNGSSFQNNPPGNYLGVRIIEPADTIYGWINVTDVSMLTFTVQEFGCSEDATGTDEQNAFIRVYPNPAFDKVFIETSFPDFNLSVYNQYGVEVFSQQHLNGKSNIDLGDMADGMCLFKIIKGRSVIVQKILKQPAGRY